MEHGRAKSNQAMNNKDYQKNIKRLQEIEQMVKDPQSSLDKIDQLLSETKKLAAQCYEYTRSLDQKLDSLED